MVVEQNGKRRTILRRARTARVGPLGTLLLGTTAAIVVLVSLLALGGPGAGSTSRQLVVYCAAVARLPMEQIAERYRREHDVVVLLQYGGSASLLNQLQIDRHGRADLFLAADQFYTQAALQSGLAEATFPVAQMQPVLVTTRVRETGITSLADLLSGDVRVALANPDEAAIGRTVRQVLSQHGPPTNTLWNQLQRQVTRRGVFKLTVTDVANDVRLGAVDAGIVWNATVAMPKYRETLGVIPAPELKSEPTLVEVATLRNSAHQKTAHEFARYLTSADAGLPIFSKNGFQPVPSTKKASAP